MNEKKNIGLKNTCMNTEQKAFEFEALVNESQAISIEVQGMRFENEQRGYLNQSMAYQEGSFQIKADEVRAIAQKLRDMK